MELRHCENFTNTDFSLFIYLFIYCEKTYLSRLQNSDSFNYMSYIFSCLFSTLNIFENYLTTISYILPIVYLPVSESCVILSCCVCTPQKPSKLGQLKFDAIFLTLNISAVYPKHANEMANNVDPDQTAREGAD